MHGNNTKLKFNELYIMYYFNYNVVFFSYFRKTTSRKEKNKHFFQFSKFTMCHIVDLGN